MKNPKRKRITFESDPSSLLPGSYWCFLCSAAVGHSSSSNTTEYKAKRQIKKGEKMEAYAAGQCNWSTSEGRGTSHRRNKKFPRGVHPQVKKKEK
jgi:hypothetical protein